MMRGEDQFHVGIVVDDLESARSELSALFGYEWCETMTVSTPVVLEGVESMVELTFTYSVTTPRVELVLSVPSVPSSPWTPAKDSGIHHLGYWSEDVAADSAELAERGHVIEAKGVRRGGTAIWTYHRAPSGPRIELVSRELEPLLEGYWGSGSSGTAS